MKTILSTLMILALSTGVSLAKDHTKTAAPQMIAGLPVCTGANSPFDVLGNKCYLVKGSNIYGDIASLSDIIPSIGNSASAGGAISAP